MKINQKNEDAVQKIINPNRIHRSIGFHHLLKKLLTVTFKLDFSGVLCFNSLQRLLKINQFDNFNNTIYSAMLAIIYAHGLFYHLHLLYGDKSAERFLKRFPTDQIANKITSIILDALTNTPNKHKKDIHKLITASLDLSLSDGITKITKNSTLTQLILIEKLTQDWMCAGQYILKKSKLNATDASAVKVGNIFFQRQRKDRWLIHYHIRSKHLNKLLNDTQCKQAEQVYNNQRNFHDQLEVHTFQDILMLNNICLSLRLASGKHLQFNSSETQFKKTYKKFHQLANIFTLIPKGSFEQGFKRSRNLFERQYLKQLGIGGVLTLTAHTILGLICLVYTITKVSTGNLKSGLLLAALTIILWKLHTPHYEYHQNNRNNHYFKLLNAVNSTILEKQVFTCVRYNVSFSPQPDDKPDDKEHSTAPPTKIFKLESGLKTEEEINEIKNLECTQKVLKRYQIQSASSVAVEEQKLIKSKPAANLPTHCYMTKLGQIIKIDPKEIVTSGRLSDTEKTKAITRFSNAAALMVYKIDPALNRQSPNGRNKSYTRKIKRGSKDRFPGRLLVETAPPPPGFENRPYYVAEVYSPRGGHKGR